MLYIRYTERFRALLLHARCAAFLCHKVLFQGLLTGYDYFATKCVCEFILH